MSSIPHFGFRLLEIRYQTYYSGCSPKAFKELWEILKIFFKTFHNFEISCIFFHLQM